MRRGEGGSARAGLLAAELARSLSDALLKDPVEGGLGPETGVVGDVQVVGHKLGEGPLPTNPLEIARMALGLFRRPASLVA